MDGSKKETFYQKALDRGLIPSVANCYRLCNDPAAFADLGKTAPIIIENRMGWNNTMACAIVDAKAKVYKHGTTTNPIVERLCRGLILKNSLNNL